MDTKHCAIACTALFLLGLALGRYSLPAKIVTKTETADKNVLVESKDRTDHSKVTVVTTKRPDGTIVTERHIDYNVDSKTDKKDTDSRTSNTETDTTYNTESFYLSGMYGLRPNSEPAYGMEFSYRLIGPVRIGAFGMTDKTIGLTLGLSF